MRNGEFGIRNSVRFDVIPYSEFPIPHSADCLRGLERAPSRGNGESPEEHLLLLAEQVVAPVYGPTQCLLARGEVALAAYEQTQTVLQARQHSLVRQQRYSSTCPL